MKVGTRIRYRNLFSSEYSNHEKKIWYGTIIKLDEFGVEVLWDYSGYSTTLPRYKLIIVNGIQILKERHDLY